VPLRAVGVGEIDAKFIEGNAEQVRRVPDVVPRLSGENTQSRTIEAPDKRLGRDLGQIFGCEASGRHSPGGHLQRVCLSHELSLGTPPR
jgi:hypothetical protein